MRFKRSQRVQELLLEEISKLIQSGLKDPRVGFSTLTRVEVSDNLKHATVFVSVMGSEEEKNQTLEALKNAKGFIRNYLGKNLYLKYLPELEFKKYKNAEHVQKITRILKDLRPKSDSQPL